MTFEDFKNMLGENPVQAAIKASAHNKTIANELIDQSGRIDEAREIVPDDLEEWKSYSSERKTEVFSWFIANNLPWIIMTSAGIRQFSDVIHYTEVTGERVPYAVSVSLTNPLEPLAYLSLSDDVSYVKPELWDYIDSVEENVAVQVQYYSMISESLDAVVKGGPADVQVVLDRMDVAGQGSDALAEVVSDLRANLSTTMSRDQVVELFLATTLDGAGADIAVDENGKVSDIAFADVPGSYTSDVMKAALSNTAASISRVLSSAWGMVTGLADTVFDKVTDLAAAAVNYNGPFDGATTHPEAIFPVVKYPVLQQSFAATDTGRINLMKILEQIDLARPSTSASLFEEMKQDMSQTLASPLTPPYLPSDLVSALVDAVPIYSFSGMGLRWFMWKQPSNGSILLEAFPELLTAAEGELAIPSFTAGQYGPFDADFATPWTAGVRRTQYDTASAQRALIGFFNQYRLTGSGYARKLLIRRGTVLPEIFNANTQESIALNDADAPQTVVNWLQYATPLGIITELCGLITDAAIVAENFSDVPLVGKFMDGNELWSDKFLSPHIAGTYWLPLFRRALNENPLQVLTAVRSNHPLSFPVEPSCPGEFDRFDMLYDVPTADLNWIRTAAIAFVGIAIAVTISGIVIARKIKKWKATRKAVAEQRLFAARQQFNNDPSKRNSKKLLRATRRVDRLNRSSNAASLVSKMGQNTAAAERDMISCSITGLPVDP